MAITPQYADFLKDLFAPLGHVQIKRMFGGAGVFYSGVMIALAVAEELYLKVDAETEPVFEEAGREPFLYARGGKQVALSFRAIPESCFDDVDDLLEWGRLAVEAAFREDAKKPPSKRKRID